MKKVVKITDKIALQQRLARLLQHRNPRSFPGAQPISFERKHLVDLLNQDFKVSEKADGTRYLLYSGVFVDGGQPESYLVKL